MRVGIDLGTTNSAVAVADDEGVHDFPIAQLVAPSEVARRPVLPSFLYLPAGPELPEGALALAWGPSRAYVVGELARAAGSAGPGRFGCSGKAWLCHAGVDREAQILPWGAVGEMPRVSPVEASARYLLHLREAWDASHAEKLASLEVVLTVPASFDEVARELTVAAAQQAGLGRITLLEEPLAAFYAWLSAAREIPPDGLILVCDIGGGTTDFTLIRSELGALDRVAVGDHLLLGGDNMDLALARRGGGRAGPKGAARPPAPPVHPSRVAQRRCPGAKARPAHTAH